jgi:hypothetical protein
MKFVTGWPPVLLRVTAGSLSNVHRETSGLRQCERLTEGFVDEGGLWSCLPIRAKDTCRFGNYPQYSCV